MNNYERITKHNYDCTELFHLLRGDVLKLLAADLKHAVLIEDFEQAAWARDRIAEHKAYVAPTLNVPKPEDWCWSETTKRWVLKPEYHLNDVSTVV